MGAWIEIFETADQVYIMDTSHPTMGAWIEIKKDERDKLYKRSRTPRWVRGLKSA